MARTVAEMTTAELRKFVSAVVGEKLMQLFADPDKGFVLRECVHRRLLRQKRNVAKGERGEPLEAVKA